MKWFVASRMTVSALVAAAAVALVGCSKKDGATVHGTVTYKGVALKTGTITFYGGNNEVASAAIQPDGSYTCTGVPAGEVKVTVEQFGAGLPGGSKAGATGMPGGSTLPGKGSLPGAAPPGGGGLISPGSKAMEKTKAPDNAPPVPELAKLPANVAKQDTTPLKYTIDSNDKSIDVIIP